MDYDREYGEINSYRNYREETAAEFDAGDVRDRDVGIIDSGAIYSYIGIVLAIFSMFVMPTTFALAAIALGVISLFKRAVWLGTFSIMLGAVSLFIQFFWTSFSWF